MWLQSKQVIEQLPASGKIIQSGVIDGAERTIGYLCKLAENYTVPTSGKKSISV